ncbi:hypothetical protein SCARD494_12500 [Seiridium cardinale]
MLPSVSATAPESFTDIVRRKGRDPGCLFPDKDSVDCWKSTDSDNGKTACIGWVTGGFNCKPWKEEVFEDLKEVVKNSATADTHNFGDKFAFLLDDVMKALEGNWVQGFKTGYHSYDSDFIVIDWSNSWSNNATRKRRTIFRHLNTRIQLIACWMTRVWTYQEIKLATSTVIAKRAGFVGFETMTSELERAAKRETGDDYNVTSRGKYPSLYKTITRLQRHTNLGVSLPDIALACGDRSATDSRDYARALFPTLGIHWHMGDTITDAMRRIYETRKRDATRLVLYHGSPQAAYPGWAPATFPGLVDCKIVEAGS